MVKGQCECGQVAFEVKAPRADVTVCHCSQCRRTSGHQWAATRAPIEDVIFSSKEGLRWYASSDFAKRGFCQNCGSSLFYRMNGEDGIGIAVGCLDDTSGMKVARHIFVKDKADYYEIGDDAEQIDAY